ncbi:hypothetical protein C2G38_2089145 [Gigaspora rosea]|uniref:Uncharacterized protein n=1 Tax=Gigaspora rosea TaxID=44941 RepID=A0A397V5B3_9GLOM|nr:hypothetical protein C2G38_2089145 [Gigaspora rosea]
MKNTNGLAAQARSHWSRTQINHHLRGIIPYILDILVVVECVMRIYMVYIGQFSSCGSFIITTFISFNFHYSRVNVRPIFKFDKYITIC